MIEYTKQNSIHRTAAKFKIDRKTVKLWKTQENLIREAVQRGEQDHCRIEGVGRPIKHKLLDDELTRWVACMRQDKQLVSRRRLQAKAKEIHTGIVCTDPTSAIRPFSASNGWHQRFMSRHNLGLRCVTTTCQQTPSDYLNRLVSFVLYNRRVICEENIPISGIYGCDETAVWLDAASNTTVETRGSKQVVVRTTGHEKMRITVVLCARADGVKCPPYVLIPRKRPMKELILRFDRKITLNFAGTSWMNQALTEDFIQKTIGSPFFLPNRLLVWDSFRSHISQEVACFFI